MNFQYYTFYIIEDFHIIKKKRNIVSVRFPYQDKILTMFIQIHTQKGS